MRYRRSPSRWPWRWPTSSTIDRLLRGRTTADGSGDPYALRRAALGVIRLIREVGLRLALADVIGEAFFGSPQATGSTASRNSAGRRRREAEIRLAGAGRRPAPADGRLLRRRAARLPRRTAPRPAPRRGRPHDIVAAVFGAAADDDLTRLLAAPTRSPACWPRPTAPTCWPPTSGPPTPRIDNRKDGRHDGPVDPALLAGGAERALGEAVAGTTKAVPATPWPPRTSSPPWNSLPASALRSMPSSTRSW